MAASSLESLAGTRRGILRETVRRSKTPRVSRGYRDCSQIPHFRTIRRRTPFCLEFYETLLRKSAAERRLLAGNKSVKTRLRRLKSGAHEQSVHSRPTPNGVVHTIDDIGAQASASERGRRAARPLSDAATGRDLPSPRSGRCVLSFVPELTS